MFKGATDGATREREEDEELQGNTTQVYFLLDYQVFVFLMFYERPRLMVHFHPFFFFN